MKFMEKFIQLPENGYFGCKIVPNKKGKYVVGNVSFGDRDSELVIYKSKMLINRDNGLGIRLCFLDDSLVGKRVNIIYGEC